MADQLSFPGFPKGAGLVQSLLGNETIKAILIWQVAGQLIEPILAPVLIPLQQELLKLHPDTVLSPAELVEAYIKGHIDKAALHDGAAQSGIASDNADLLAKSAGEPPGLAQLLELYRRGLIPKTSAADAVSLEQGIRESRLLDKWVAAVEALRYATLDPAEAVAAAVRGNLDPAAAEKAAEEAGVDPAHFQTMVHNAGRPPSPGELLELAKRGLIPWDGVGPDAISFQQGIYEGDTKDKWEPIYRRLADYIPPPRTVTALLREGSISEATAAQLLRDAGLSPELAADYINAASKQHTTAAKDLSKTEVLQLYAEGIMGEAAAVADLVRLGLKEADARELLQLQDLRRSHQYQTQVVGRIRSLYLGHHISDQQATEALRESGTDQGTITHLLTLWALERPQLQERITGAQIASAVYYKALSHAEGFAALQGIGYTPFDAWIILADRLHAPPDDIPRPPLPAWAG